MLDVTTVAGERRVNLSYTDLLKIIRMLLCGVDVNEKWYLHQYEDIARAVRSGAVTSAKRHFVDDGYFEGRRPYPMPVDELWYLRQNPDVADSIRKGVVHSGQQHFEEDGYREGRLPFVI
jgi:hypothetical protein